MGEFDREQEAFERALAKEAESFAPSHLDDALIAQRARRAGRGRTLLAAAAVTAVIAGSAVAVALLRTSTDGGDGPDQADTSTFGTSADELEEGWRYESFRDVQVQVPVSWEYGWAPGRDWCATVGRDLSGFPTKPYVDMRGPFSGELSILCGEGGPTPDLSDSGVPRRFWAPHLAFTFAEQNDGPPEGTISDAGWTRIVRTIGGTRISVLTDQVHLADARRIVDSAVVVDVDANGCPATSQIQAKHFLRPEPAFDVRALGSVDSISVCQYVLGAGTAKPGMLASRMIAGVSARNQLLEAIKAAPAGGGPDTPDTCAHDYIDGTAIVLRLREGDAVHDMYVYYESCINNGFDDGTTRRALTSASCQPLWDGRVQYTSGSSAPFRVCHEGQGNLTK